MIRILLAMALIAIAACSKSSSTAEDKERNLSVSIVDYNPPNLTNHYWAVKLQLNKPATMSGNIIVQHDLWDLGIFKKTYIDTFDFSLNNESSFQFNTMRNSLLQGPEIKNIKVNKFTQKSGDYNVTIK
jgi:hypothetical protein